MTARRLKFLALAATFGVAAFVAGVHVLGPAAPRHPLTGRQIAGIATDAAWMDRAEREAEEQPDRALDFLGITPGMVVADVGAGSGYMTMRLAGRVGPTGRVYANDVQPGLLRILQAKAEAAHLSNVVIVRGTDTDVNLPAAEIDLALLVDVYHEFRHPQEMLRSIRRALTPNGRLALIEYRGEDPTIPIAPTHRMTVADARVEVEAEGFGFDQAIEELPRQHILLFRTSKTPSSG